MDEKKAFTGEAGGYFINKAAGVTSDPGENQSSLVLSTVHSYVIRFRTGLYPFELKISRGVGNFNPRQQVVYKDVLLPAGTAVKLTLTPKGIGDLLYDEDGNGTFESRISP